MRAHLPALLLAACGTAAAAHDSYRAQPLPRTAFAVPQDVFAPILRGFPQGREGRQALDLSVRKDDRGRYVVLLTISGLLDDSVAAEQQRAVMRYEDGGWRVIALGRRWRCQRGRGPSGWTTRLCS